MKTSKTKTIKPKSALKVSKYKGKKSGAQLLDKALSKIKH